MKYCSKCGTELADDAAFCVKCGTATQAPAPEQTQTPAPVAAPAQAAAPTPPPEEPDAPSGGFAVLSFFFPLVGLILFIVWSGSKPLRAKSCGRGALIGFLVSIVVWIIIIVAIVVAAS
jgi:hypothetical protein